MPGNTRLTQLAAQLAGEAMRRKLAKARDPLLSAIIREAVVAYLTRDTRPEEVEDA
jgi:hypothetical protein